MSENASVTYGNIIKPGRLGILGLPLGVSLSLVPVVMLMAVLLATGNIIQALILVALTAVATALMLWRGRADGRNIYERGALMFAHRRKVKKGNNLYLAGPAGRVPDGKMRVPGLLAASELSEHTDAYGNPFGLIRVRSTKHYTVVLEAFPDGDQLVDQKVIDSQVGHWGAWMAQLGVDGGIVGASVTVETAPDSGLRLARMTRGNLSESASAFSAAVVNELPDHYNAGSPSVTTRIAITFSGKGLDKDATDRGISIMVEEIANRLPNLIGNLYSTGAGTSVRACTAQDIVDFTRTSYDPTVATLIEEARAEGGTGLSWADAGPVFHDDQLDRYFHDRAVSKSWEMFEGPRGQFYSSALRRIMEPTPNVLRKRVTILYRPIPSSESASLVESDINNATFAGSQKQRPSARQRQRLAFAEKAAQEEAQGAGLVRFGMIITATTATSDDFPRLDKIIPNMANSARLRIRPALGNQAVAFQAGLPLGVVLAEHSLLDDKLRAWL